MNSECTRAPCPLHPNLAGLEQLLAVSLQMIALTLSSELSTGLGTLPPERAQQLALYIDRWCDIEARAEV